MKTALEVLSWFVMQTKKPATDLKHTSSMPATTRAHRVSSVESTASILYTVHTTEISLFAAFTGADYALNTDKPNVRHCHRRFMLVPCKF